MAIASAVPGTPGAMIRAMPMSSHVKLTVFDVTDPTAPQVVQATYLDGNYVESRAVGDDVYVVLQNGLDNLPAPTVHESA